MSRRTFTLLSTSDTDLLAARTSDSSWRLGNPYRVGDLVEFAGGTDLVVFRILGSRRKYEDMVAPLLDLGVPVVVLGGEQLPDAELMGLSTVPMGVATEAHAYLAQGGPENLVQLHRFLADTVLLTRATLDDGDTVVPLTNSQPVQYVLLWITHLGGGGSDNSTEIRELSFRRVAD